MRPRVAHVITSLGIGGAQTMLYQLLAHRQHTAAVVVGLVGTAPVGERIRALGVPVASLGMRPGVPDPRGVLRLAAWLRRSRVEIVHTWMYHANLVGGLAARLAGRVPVVWGLHHADPDPARLKPLTRAALHAGARLSARLPERIVCCSEATRRVHAGLGYATAAMEVIPNGFDVAALQPDPEARRALRAELGIPPDAVVIGLVARFSPPKDHAMFAAAAARLGAGVRFVLCGEGVTWDNRTLVDWIDAAGPRERYRLLGARDDIGRLMSAFDLLSLTSWSEGCPNAVGEAMACGVPCVVTDVGDAALMVGDTGYVVPPRDPAALATAWRMLIALGRDGRRRLGLAARHRIAERFSLSEVVRRYESLYTTIAGAAERAAA